MNVKLEVLVCDSKEVKVLEFPVKFHEITIEAYEFRNIFKILYPEGMYHIPVS